MRSNEGRLPQVTGRSSWDHVRAAQSGDTDAFAQLYRRYWKDAYGYLLAVTRTISVAEDLTSETFVRAFAKIGAVQERENDVRAWILTIARNLAADHYRSLRVRREVLSDRVIDSSVFAESAEQAALRNQLRADLLEALDRLSVPQRECLFLRFYRDLSCDRTADALGSNSGAVRALQYRAVRELATVLTEEHSPSDLMRDAA